MSAFRVRPMLDPLEKEQREIERRRQRLQERTKRVLHAKTRLIGVDTLALEQQVREKQDRERVELERDFFYDDLSASHARAVTEQEARRQAQERKERSELKYYRKAQEQEKRRQALRTESAATQLRDMDTSFLQFQGEDVEKMNRVRAQQRQQQDWLAQQLSELSAKEAREAQDQADYENMQQRINQIQEENEDAARRGRRLKEQQTREHNKQIAAANASRKARDMQLNQKLEDVELSNQLSSTFLNEGVAANAGTANFKGFTTSERQRILDEQKFQMDERQAMRAQEESEEQDYARYQEDIRRAMIRADREKAAQRQQERDLLAAERSVQAKEKTLRYDYLDKVVYPNEVTDGFFEQFGKSCR